MAMHMHDMLKDPEFAEFWRAHCEKVFGKYGVDWDAIFPDEKPEDPEPQDAKP